MLFPSKHDNPDQTIIAVATTMIKYLSRYKVVEYSALLGYCKSKTDKIEYLFSPAIDLLYILGLVRYLPKSDCFEWAKS
ncbi:ABC-three component system middle component 8 [Bifidobacterium psychraerophilum]|uniref:Uncharacterized protein n=1 Tax=Bifidobacterium psychraerophilum TaxID=218140 RepID=A0A087CCP4_9BIFI|nr:hypothetical protein BPSY_1452 [Bifidobacterium psychraerophilum]PKA95389.1 hypothetical protein A9A89_1654 [Bifidobacterium psychraerophilum DSM 22366]